MVDPAQAHSYREKRALKEIKERLVNEVFLAFLVLLDPGVTPASLVVRVLWDLLDVLGQEDRLVM